jgi:hypothetical protein
MNPTAFIERTQAITIDDLSHGKTTGQIVLSTISEMGEFCEELRIEEKVFSHAHKVPDEGTLGEGVDVVICALALYFSRPGSSIEHLTEYGMKKLDKWAGQISKAAKG